MSAHNIQSELAAGEFPATWQGFKSPAGYHLAFGTVVPTITTAGFAPGCIFVHSDGTTGTLLYVNVGTKASCNFVQLMAEAVGAVGATITQTYSTAATTHDALTAAAHTYPASGNMFDATAADLLINIRTDSDANVAADAAANIKSVAANLNQLLADVTNVKGILNSVVDVLQAKAILG